MIRWKLKYFPINHKIPILLIQNPELEIYGPAHNSVLQIHRHKDKYRFSLVWIYTKGIKV